MTPAIAALHRAGIRFATHAFGHRSGSRDHGMEAATAIGIDPDQVFKTLVVRADGATAVAIVPVNRQLSSKATAAALGVKRVELCEPALAERMTVDCVPRPRRPLLAARSLALTRSHLYRVLQ